MDPIRETREALDELGPPADDDDLLGRLQSLATEAQDLVPDLVGVSITWRAEDLTFTLVASDQEIAVLDAVQYATDGPCEVGARSGDVVEYRHDDVLDEEDWRVFARPTAARPVRSTLTLPVLQDDVVVGSVNLYAASDHAFAEHHEALAEVFGAWAAGAVSNADLSFETRRDAMAAPRVVRDRVLLATAVGILAAEAGEDVEVAEQRLLDAAARARVDPLDLARVIVDSRDADPD